MKILTGNNIREADFYTMRNEPVSSLDLMERASQRIADYISDKFPKRTEFVIFAGKGNNGGDGLVVARILSLKRYKCRIITLFDRTECSEEYQSNYRILPEEIAVEKFTGDNILNRHAVVIDAILGTGVKRIVSTPVKEAVEFINRRQNTVISIDMPSGMTTEFGNKDRAVVKSDITLTLQFPKLSLLLPEGGDNAGEMVVLPIGLDREFMEKSDTVYNFVTAKNVAPMDKKRRTFSNKGIYGHALLICGKKGMMGAAVLSTSSALRSGCGLVTIHIPESERNIIQTTNPSAIVSCYEGDAFGSLPEKLDKYKTIGIGSGMGTAKRTVEAMRGLLSVYRSPMVLDADALNILSENNDIIPLIPENSILTPHPGELERLIGEWDGDEEKINKVAEFVRKYKIIMVVKGAYTMICPPDGKIYFNSTGNPGMSKGGNGDVLTGLITGYLAKGMEPLQAAIKGVFDHGRAGDDAALAKGVEQMNSEDIVDFL
ncbi:MAG: NAD(P)H-hydrate dehydratase [Rikenellaceae bacterium]|nr:NAD(P)H-hydrate dehydratase [Rikenellaceae bacterium]